MTCRSPITPNSADWVSGKARMSSSDYTISLKTSPGRQSKACLSASKTFRPTISAGTKFGVNWMRLKLQPSVAASAFSRVVLPPYRSYPRSSCGHRATMQSSRDRSLPRCQRSGVGHRRGRHGPVSRSSQHRSNRIDRKSRTTIRSCRQRRICIDARNDPVSIRIWSRVPLHCRRVCTTHLVSRI